MAVCIEIDHPEVESFFIFQQHEAIGANSKFTVTDLPYLPDIFFRETSVSVVKYDKIIARTLIFREF